MNERCEDKRLEMVMRNNGKLLVGSGPHDLIPLSSISRPLIPSTPTTNLPTSSCSWWCSQWRWHSHRPHDHLHDGPTTDAMTDPLTAKTEPMSDPISESLTDPMRDPRTSLKTPWPNPDWLHRQHPDQDPDFDHDQKLKIVTSGQFYHIDLVYNYPISFFSFKLLCNLSEPKMAFLSLAFPMENFHTTYQANEYSWTHWMRFILSSTHKGGAACNIHCPLSCLTLSVHFTQQVRMNQWEESSHLNGWGQPNRI